MTGAKLRSTATSGKGDTVMSEEQQWVVAPDEARIEIAFGREAKLSSEVQQALDRLIAAVERQQEVQGYFHCPDVQVMECKAYVQCVGVQGF